MFKTFRVMSLKILNKLGFVSILKCAPEKSEESKCDFDVQKYVSLS